MIETLRLKNFRRYDDQRFTFTSGVNYLLGENNAGKTTLFYALEYVLFGTVAGFRSLAMMMRAKARDMGVELVFTGRDGGRYRLQRMHQRPPRAKTQINGHFTLKQIHGEGDEQYLLSSDFQDHEEALAQRLSQILGVGRRLFELALHLRQGEIPAMLAGTPKLDMLLGITAAVQANGELRAAALEFEKATQGIAVLQESLRHAEGERDLGRERLDTLQAEASGVAGSIDAQQAELARIATVKGALGELLAGLKDYRQRRRDLDDHGRALEQARVNLDAFVAEHGDRLALNRALAALEDTGENERAAQRTAMEAAQRELRDLDRKLGDIRGRIERRRALPAGQDARCESCGQPIDHNLNAREIAAWEDELQAIEAEQARLQQARETADRALQQLLQDEQDRRLKQQATTSRLTELERLESAVATATEALAGEDSLAAHWRTLAAEIAPLTAAIAALDEPPALDLADDLTEDHAEDLEQRLGALDVDLGQRHTRLTTEIAAKNDLTRRLQADTDEARSRIAAAEREIARLATEVARLHELAAHARRLRVCAKAFAELQVRLREQTAGALAEQTLALHGQLTDTKELKALRVDPESYAIWVKSKDMGTEAPAYLAQGGGQRQLLGLAFRLALARLVGRPPFLLLDEPTDGLDAHHRDLLIERLEGVEASEQLLVVTHQDKITAGHRIQVSRDGGVSRAEVLE